MPAKQVSKVKEKQKTALEKYGPVEQDLFTKIFRALSEDKSFDKIVEEGITGDKQKITVVAEAKKLKAAKIDKIGNVTVSDPAYITKEEPKTEAEDNTSTGDKLEKEAVKAVLEVQTEAVRDNALATMQQAISYGNFVMDEFSARARLAGFDNIEIYLNKAALFFDLYGQSIENLTEERDTLAEGLDIAILKLEDLSKDNDNKSYLIEHLSGMVSQK